MLYLQQHSHGIEFLVIDFSFQGIPNLLNFLDTSCTRILEMGLNPADGLEQLGLLWTYSH